MRALLKLIPSTQREEWDQEVRSIPGWDVYYLSGYSIPFAEHSRLPIYCLCYADDEGKVVYPFHLREIDFAPGYYDMISPYGYGGPLLSSPSERLAENFRKAMIAYCQEKQIVSEFVRFHPLLQNHQWMEPYMDVEYNRDTVEVDLAGNPDDLWSNMAQKHRNVTRKGLKSGAKTVIGREWLGDFARLYQSTMEHRQASSFYLFSEEFFLKTMETLPEQAELFTVIYEGKAIAGAIVLHSPSFAHYHFAASDREYLHLNPNNILMFSIMQWAQERGICKLHLGGGYQGGEDSLFKFKAGFSKNGRTPFYLGKTVIMPDMYQQLVEEQAKIPGIRQHANFFPVYRSFYREG